MPSTPQSIGRAEAAKRRRKRAHDDLRHAAAASATAMRCHAAQRRMAARMSVVTITDLEAIAAELEDLGRHGPETLARAVRLLALGG